MAWFKVDDCLEGNPKVLQCSHAAMGLWVLAGSWCARNLTGGEVPSAFVDHNGGCSEAQELVEAGLWEETPSGWKFHDWSNFNLSSDQLKEQRRKRSEAGRIGGLTRGNNAKQKPSKSLTSASSKRQANAKQVLGESLPPSQAKSNPIPIPNKENTKESREPEGFAEFYKTYPKHVARGQAIKAYKTAAKDTDPAVLLAGAVAYAKLTATTEPKFIKQPATWLNGQCWLDETPAEPELKPIPKWWER